MQHYKNKKMKPLRDLVLIKPIKPDETKNGLIIIPNAQLQNKGKVVAIGVKTKLIKIGDTVMYYQNSGTLIDYNNEEHLLVSEEHEVISIL